MPQNRPKKPSRAASDLQSQRLLALYKKAKSKSPLISLLIEIGEQGADLILITGLLDIYCPGRIPELSDAWPLFVKAYGEKLKRHKKKIKGIRSALRILDLPPLGISKEWDSDLRKNQQALKKKMSEYINSLELFAKDYYSDWFHFQSLCEAHTDINTAIKIYQSEEWCNSELGRLERYSGRWNKDIEPKIMSQSSHGSPFLKKIILIIDELKRVQISARQAYTLTGKLLYNRYPYIYKDSDPDLVRQRYNSAKKNAKRPLKKYRERKG